MDVCPKCSGNGWLCEKHPGMHWPHASTRKECSAQGIPCDCPAGAYVLPHRVIWLKLERGTHLTARLSEEIKAFLARETDTLGSYHDRAPGEALIRQQLSRVVPMSLSLLSTGPRRVSTTAIDLEGATARAVRAIEAPADRRKALRTARDQLANRGLKVQALSPHGRDPASGTRRRGVGDRGSRGDSRHRVSNADNGKSSPYPVVESKGQVGIETIRPWRRVSVLQET